MPESSIDLSDCADVRPLSEIVATLRRHASSYDPLLVGATARDVLLSQTHRLPIARATLDCDFAFFVRNWAHYERLRASLLESEEIREDPLVHHRVLFKGDRRIDLLPFGGVEDVDRMIAWPPRGDRAMRMLGFQEAGLSAVDVRLPSRQHVAVVSLPAQAILKLVAWHDRRRHESGKHAEDLLFLLRHYLEAGNDQRLYSESAALLDDPRFDWEKCGAWLIGADARNVLGLGQDPKAALAWVAAVLESEIQPDGPLQLAGEMRAATLQTALDLLRAFHGGLTGRGLSDTTAFRDGR